MEIFLVWYYVDRVGYKCYFIVVILYDLYDWFGYIEYIFKNFVIGKIDVVYGKINFN